MTIYLCIIGRFTHGIISPNRNGCNKADNKKSEDNEPNRPLVSRIPCSLFFLAVPMFVGACLAGFLSLPWSDESWLERC